MADPGRWEELVAAAVLGTERRPFHGWAVPGPLGTAVAGAGDLGRVAASVWAYRQAGRAPDGAVAPGRGVGAGPVASGTGPVAPDDPRPLLPPGPIRTLRAVLGDPGRRALLPEWLRLAARDGRRLLPEWIPDLLEACGPGSRPDLNRVGGPRVGWLAARYPAPSGSPSGGGARMAAAVLAGGEDSWDDAGLADGERLAAFAAVRSADPALAGRLAARILPSEPGSTRAAMLSALGPHLSMADEPVLEGRLDDRRRDVRAGAAELLRRLPVSRLARRMAARTLPLVTPGSAPSGSAPSAGAPAAPALEVTLPGQPDQAARRDGIGAGGDRRAELAQMVAATPLASWVPHLVPGGSPADVVARASRSGPAGASLLSGWSAAAVATADGDWARALLDGGARPAAGLVALVPAEVADRAAAAWLEVTPLAQALPTLLGYPVPWTASVSQAVLAGLTRLVESGDTAGAAPVRDALGAVALALDPAAAAGGAALAETLERLPDGPRGAARLFWGRPVTQLTATLQFRHAMCQEFR